MTHPTRILSSRLTLRRLAAVLVVWALAAGGAIALADALDSPVGVGARDAAQPSAPAVADPTRPPASLPPLALVLDRPPPDGIARLAPIRQAGRLRQLAAHTGDARHHVQLGSALQVLGDGPGAVAAYRSALSIGGQDVAARTGLALADGATGTAGQGRAAAVLARVARENPRSQLVAFNQGWLDIYRRRAAPARAAWQRAVDLGPETRLGRTALALLSSLGERGSGRNP